MQDRPLLDPSNAAQAEYWNTAGGKRWTAHQAVLDRALAPFGAAVLERSGVRPGDRVLDVGCGCGDTSLAFADAVGETGGVLGVDLSDAMIGRARERAVGRYHVRFVAADATQLATDQPFDRIVSRFGVMFFGDPVAAFRHLRSLLRAGGRLTFACWRSFEDNPWGLVPKQAVLRALPEAKDETFDPTGPGPFAFAERTRVEDVLKTAGFATIRIEPFDSPVLFSTGSLEEAVEFAVVAGPSARLLAGADPDAIARVRAELGATLAPYRGPAGIALSGGSWLVTAG